MTPIEETSGTRRGRGRPRGPTPQGVKARERLYDTAIRLIGTRGYEATTLRNVAKKAGVSVGLLHRYFPSKRAIVLALYENLSAEYAARAAQMSPGTWRDRFLYALKTSLEVLGPHRRTLAALVPVLVGDSSEGLFAPRTAFSRLRVQKVFGDAVFGAVDAPKPDVGEALGRLLYLAHLAIILWWLLDRSPRQRATIGLLTLLDRALPAAALAARLPLAQTFVVLADALFREALFTDETPVRGAAAQAGERSSLHLSKPPQSEGFVKRLRP